MPPSVYYGPGVKPPPAQNIVQTAYNTATAAKNTQANDYDTLMNNYRGLFADASANAGSTPKLSPYTPSTYQYKPSSAFTGAVGTLSNLANTGGYSQSDIADLRSRGVSPIRAVYANAQTNLDRQKALQGGYSPGYTAASARMSRDEAEQASQGVQNVNASIANNVAGNRLSAAGSLGSLTSGENSLQNNIGENNTSILNDASKYNSQLPLLQSQLNGNNLQARLATLNPQASLYGTTPALASTFGNQVGQYANVANSATQTNNNNTLNTIGQIMRYQ